MEIKKIFVCLIAGIMVTTAPLVFAATTDTLDIQFDPNGDIDIDVNYPWYNFSGVNAAAWDNTTGNYFTLYNNGTVAMDTDIRAENKTWQNAMILNESTAGPGQDEYAFFVMDLSSAGYVNDSYDAFNSYFDYNLAPSGSKAFDVGLLIGTSLSSNHTGQNFTVYFRGSQT